MKNTEIETDHAAEVEKGKEKGNIEKEVKTGNFDDIKYFFLILRYSFND